MFSRLSLAAAASLIAGLIASSPAIGGELDKLVPERGLGDVHMGTSCKPAVRDPFDRGLALLHSFWYDRALPLFDRVIAMDPNCAMAYWGAAMTYNHPLWAPPSADDIKHAVGYLDRAKKAMEANDRERRYLAALRDLYGDGKPDTKPARDAAYLSDMAAIYKSYSDDETALFYALAIDGTMRDADPAKIGLASGLLDAVHKHQPRHPGALHYLIHTYDFDGYAERGLPAARAYAASAPAIPHALHMPSHIFLRLGYWQDAVASNVDAWRASEDSVKRAGEHGSDRDFHTLSFLQYARLQLGQFAEARRETLIALDQFDDNMRRIKAGATGDERDNLLDLSFEATGMASSYMAESGDYSLVERLPVETASPPIGFVQDEVRALAATRQRDETAVTRSLAVGRRLLDPQTLTGLRPRGRSYALICGHEILAAIAQYRGDRDTAVAEMKLAVAAEDALPTFYQPAMPPIPAHEMFGKMLAGYHDDAGAYDQFAAALARTPNRPQAMLGIANAARQLGKIDESTAWSAKYAALMQTADKP